MKKSGSFSPRAYGPVVEADTPADHGSAKCVKGKGCGGHGHRKDAAWGCVGGC